jgi:hypothetical protein
VGGGMIKAWMMKGQSGVVSGSLLANKDNYLQHSSPTYEAGQGMELCVANGFYTLIIAFDISGLPKVSEAILSLYAYFIEGASRSHVVSRMLITDWTEGPTTYWVGVSNWNSYKAGTNWNGEGCSGAETDFTANNQVSSNTPTSAGWQQWDITNLWNDAIDDSQTLLSLVITSPSSFGNSILYNSRHNASNVPVIDYVG